MPTFRFCESCGTYVAEDLEVHKATCISDVSSSNNPIETSTVSNDRQNLQDERICEFCSLLFSCEKEFSLHKMKCERKVIKREKCEGDINQCPSSGTVCFYCGKETKEELNLHLQVCDFTLVDCTNCQVRVQKRYMGHHLTEDCLKRIVQCEYCKIDAVANVLQEHFDVCELFPVYCENKCELKRSELKQHLLEECPKRIIECEYCLVELEAQLLEEHHSTCGKFPVTCPEVCGSIVPRDDVEKHLDESCLKKYSKCTYEEMSCTFEGSPAGLREHLNENRDFHSELMKDQINLLLNIVESQDKKIEGFEIYLQEMEESVGDMEERLIKAESRLKRKFLWKITEVSEKLASVKFHDSFSSDHFYDSDYGYKLQVRLYPNGVNLKNGMDYKDTLSVFICICSGEYDSVLEWPFMKRVTFKLIDQGDEKNDIVDYIKGSDRECFQKPEKGCTKVALGCPDLITHKKLKSGSYIQDDTIFIEVTVE